MPDYDPDVQAAALAEMDQLTAGYRAAEEALEQARQAVAEGIVRHHRERSAPPGQIAEHSPYDRNHVGRIVRAAGVEPLRPPKPKPRKRAAPKPSA